MELLIIVLNKVELLNDLLSALVEVGITKATILESEGLGQHLAYEVPLFAGLRKLVGETRTNNKTIFALIEEHKLFDELHELLKKSEIDFLKDGTGVFLTVPVNQAIKYKNSS